MKNESDPIAEDEWLLRRVHKSRFRTEKLPIISPSSFEPRIEGRDPDVDGISLYREACLESPEQILTTVAENKRQDQGIVRIPVSALRRLQLGVLSAPEAPIPGHVLIPELNAGDFAASKSSFTPVLLDLATLASLDENVVMWPSSTH
jgi:hypothetical protein